MYVKLFTTLNYCTTSITQTALWTRDFLESTLHLGITNNFNRDRRIVNLRWGFFCLSFSREKEVPRPKRKRTHAQCVEALPNFLLSWVWSNSLHLRKITWYFGSAPVPTYSGSLNNTSQKAMEHVSRSKLNNFLSLWGRGACSINLIFVFRPSKLANKLAGALQHGATGARRSGWVA